MKPVKFPGQNIVFGEGQPEYQPLPALKVPGPQGEVITCWELSNEEVEIIVRSKRLYLSQLTFNKPIQPVLLMTDLGDNITLT